MCSEISLENFNVPCLPPVHAQRLKNLSGMFDFNFRLADELYICLSRTARIIIPEIVFWSSGLIFFPKSQALAVEVACVLGATRLLGDGVLPHSRTKRKPQHHPSPTLAWRDVRLTNSPIPTRHTGTRIHCIPTHLHTYLCVHVPTYNIWITDLQTLLWHLNCLWWLQNFHKTKRTEHYGTPEHPCSTGNTPWCTGRLAESPLTITVVSNTVGSAMVQSSQYDWYKLIHIATKCYKYLQRE